VVENFRFIGFHFIDTFGQIQWNIDGLNEDFSQR